jgi:hypothetical protein
VLFHAHKHALDFELGGRRYVVPLGSEVDIPDHLAYVIAARGIPLAKGPSGGPRVESAKPEPTRPQLAAVAHTVSKSEAEDALADVTGEDPADEDDDGPAGLTVDADEDEDEADVAERTFQQLQQQGIRVPGKRPGRKGR